MKELTHQNMIEEIKEGRARSNRRGGKKEYGSPPRLMVEPTSNSIE
jgi:hypothetical protein